MGLASTGLNNIFNAVEPKMRDTENALRTELGTVSDGGELTTSQLLRLQYLFARYTVSSTTFSNIIKEASDGAKGVAAKIS
ncbi:MAG: hypothetical protein ACKN9M_03965 [Burkholderiaceae bacterium]|jgi:hypothetical protein